jgi:hypothetical protein
MKITLGETNKFVFVKRVPRSAFVKSKSHLLNTDLKKFYFLFFLES